MYLAWSMTYFHINLDPRGKKKKVLPPILIPVVILEFFGFLFVFFSLNLFGVSCFFWAGFQRHIFREECWEITLQFKAPGGHLRGSGFRLCRPAHSPRMGWASIFFCLYSDILFLFLFLCFFRCSVLTPVLFQNTPVECVRLCVQGTHTL